MDPSTRGRGEQHPTDGVEQRVRRAAQGRRLPGVRQHVRERATRAEAGDASNGNRPSRCRWLSMKSAGTDDGVTLAINHGILDTNC